MLNHRKFMDYINRLQENYDRLEAVDDALAPFADESLRLSSLLYKPLDLALDLFEELLFPGAAQEVEYYVYELNFGRDKNAADCITVNWKVIGETKTYSLRNHEEFYQYLVDCEKYSR